MGTYCTRPATNLSLAGNVASVTEEPPPATMLVAEVEQLLSVGSVGLYEFVWLLRSAVPEASDSERRDLAREAVRRLLEQGGNRLVFLEWPREAVTGEARFEELRDSAWDDPTHGQPYIAIVRS